MRAFLEGGNFKAFTDTFENLYGMKQLPGIAVQRLMADGYGFGAEGDWDSSAIHDPYPLVYKGQIWLYYKGQPLHRGQSQPEN